MRMNECLGELKVALEGTEGMDGERLEIYGSEGWMWDVGT